jgi:hypothetical protein
LLTSSSVRKVAVTTALAAPGSKKEVLHAAYTFEFAPGRLQHTYRAVSQPKTWSPSADIAGTNFDWSSKLSLLHFDIDGTLNEVILIAAGKETGLGGHSLLVRASIDPYGGGYAYTQLMQHYVSAFHVKVDATPGSWAETASRGTSWRVAEGGNVAVDTLAGGNVASPAAVASDTNSPAHHHAFVNYGVLYHATWPWKGRTGPQTTKLATNVARDSVDIALDQNAAPHISYGVGAQVQVAHPTPTGWTSTIIASCASGDVVETRVAVFANELHVTYSCESSSPSNLGLVHTCTVLP